MGPAEKTALATHKARKNRQINVGYFFLKEKVKAPATGKKRCKIRESSGNRLALKCMNSPAHEATNQGGGSELVKISMG